jgi:hypothetical protein
MTQYFESKEAGANDGNSGLTELLPWTTLAKLSATAFLTADDIVNLRRGDSWSESGSVRGTGTSGHPLKFGAYGSGNRPIITSADIPVGWVFDSAVAGGDRYKIAALGWTPNSVWREDGTPVGQSTTRHLSKDTVLANCTALDEWHFTGTDLYVVVATGEVPGAGGITVHVGRRNFCFNEFSDGQDFITFSSIHFRFTNIGGSSQLDVNANSVVNEGWTVTDCLFEWGEFGFQYGGQGTNSFAQTRTITLSNCTFRYQREHGASLIFLSAGSSVYNCIFDSNGRAGLQFAARNSTVTLSSFTSNAGVANKWNQPATVQGFDAGIYVVGQVPNFDRASGNVISFCFADNNGKAGFQVDALSSNNIFHHITSVRNILFGVMFEGGTTNGSSSNSLYHATIWGNHKSGLHVINAHGPFDARNNLIYGNGTDTNSQDVYIEWNITTWTLHSGTPGVDAIYKHQHIDWDPGILGDDSHAIVTRVANLAAIVAQNQWTYDGADTGGSIYVRKTGSTAPTTCWGDPTYTLNYNTYTPVGEQPAGHAIYRLTDAGAAGQSYTTLAALQGAQAGIEVNGRQENPLFISTAILDFRLKSNSPSIDRGQIIVGINDGTGGSIKYLGSAPDIGRFEFSNSGGSFIGAGDPTNSLFIPERYIGALL